mmetsp:Transcript_9979/g.40342  ORF Transcript_9979/g.40342 Transcript_9979/m.40342 type:complete len:231 (-) Transcript_9979:1919-2611(-)
MARRGGAGRDRRGERIEASRRRSRGRRFRRGHRRPAGGGQHPHRQVPHRQALRGAQGLPLPRIPEAGGVRLHQGARQAQAREVHSRGQQDGAVGAEQHPNVRRHVLRQARGRHHRGYRAAHSGVDQSALGERRGHTGAEVRGWPKVRAAPRRVQRQVQHRGEQRRTEDGDRADVPQRRGGGWRDCVPAERGQAAQGGPELERMRAAGGGGQGEKRRRAAVLVARHQQQRG